MTEGHCVIFNRIKQLWDHRASLQGKNSANIRPVGWFLPGWDLFRLKRTLNVNSVTQNETTVIAEDFPGEVDGGVIMMPSSLREFEYLLAIVS